MAKEREVIEAAQQQVRERYLGKYAVLLRRLGPGWDKSKLSRVLSSKNPKAMELFSVCTAAGVMLAPLLQQLH